MTGQPRTAAVIGGGPAGLMAAQALCAAGAKVTVYERMPSLARKLLMAGKSGLNLTNDASPAGFAAAYGDAEPLLRRALDGFGAQDVRAWAGDLGQPLFTGSTGRVFPVAMKASPLLRAWLARLDGFGAQRQLRWRWTGWQGDALLFDTPEGPQQVQADAAVLALGGGSWARLGSDGAWLRTLAALDVETVPFAPSNAALRMDWSAHMGRHFGAPLKGIALRAGRLHSRGEAVITARGLEGGGLYPLTPALRDGAALTIDLLPDLDLSEVAKRLAAPRSGASLSNHLRKRLRLDPARRALLTECARALPGAPGQLATVIKALPVGYRALAPLDEAISTTGGVAWSGLDADLMLRARPGVFCAGEMLDWEAPTGGYLLTACLATGRLAGQGAARYLATLNCR